MTGAARRAGARIEIGTALPSVTISSSASTTGQAARIAPGSSRIPIETKKNVLNSSRRGTISPSTLSARSESARARPATKAPSATLTPSALAAKAVPMATTATPMTKSSRDRRPAISASSRGRSRDPATINSATNPMAMAPRMTRPPMPSSSRLPSAERATTSTTVTRSWTIETPSAVRPYEVVCSVRSPATLTSTTVEQTATAPPMNSASISGQPSARPGAGPDRHREGNLHRRAGQDPGPDAAELVEAELEADAEHQQRHADVGERQHILLRGHDPGREGTDGQPGGDVADHRRHAEPVGDGPEDESRCERDEQSQLEGHRRLGGMGQIIPADPDGLLCRQCSAATRFRSWRSSSCWLPRPRSWRSSPGAARSCPTASGWSSWASRSRPSSRRSTSRSRRTCSWPSSFPG